MLSPKNTKYRKPHLGRLKGKAMRCNQIAFGDYAIQALEPVWLTSRQIEATRRTLTRYMKRGGQLWIRVFPHVAITAKPAETRMGSGKGAPEYWAAPVRPNQILFELQGVAPEVAKEAIHMASYKLPIRVRMLWKTSK
uniref:Large ribosomal subunit protein uL16c n=1 Tax=Cyanidiococcus yangmingshanensis TaxID=2690220 RepID=A0A7G5VUM0_9RHOD|nr:50S ribosomal protein L16 [Cyanidiococcus yangmingshanensis]QMX77387.1 50S ribosomal protein L16 [Cyanidiococcus yangmingshanensis]